jgi:hypothetical protein
VWRTKMQIIKITLFMHSFSLYSVSRIILGKPYIHDPSTEKIYRFQEAHMSKYFSWRCQLMTVLLADQPTSKILLPTTSAVLVHYVNVIHYGIMLLFCKLT